LRVSALRPASVHKSAVFMLRAVRGARDAGDIGRFESRCVCTKATLLAEQQLTSVACERGQQSAPEHERRPRATQCQTSLRRGNCYASRVPPITNIEATVAAQPSYPFECTLASGRSGRRCPGLVSCIVKCRVQCERHRPQCRQL
jgi:hypothetical protein